MACLSVSPAVQKAAFFGTAVVPSHSTCSLPIKPPSPSEMGVCKAVLNDHRTASLDRRSALAAGFSLCVTAAAGALELTAADVALAGDEGSTGTTSAGEEAVNPLVAKLLEQSKVNKAKNDEERMKDYLKKGYGDYFKFLAGSVRKENASPTELEILQWLEKNK